MSGSNRAVLITGAAGLIGSAFAAAVHDRYTLRLADRATPDDTLDDTLNEAGEWTSFDLTNRDACRAACDGIDTVVHLGADPSPEADFYASLLDNNIKGTHNIFEAAHEAGCRRVVFASSVQAVEGYPVDVQVHANMPVRPPNLYGVSKCFGEALAAYYGYQTDLSCIAVRIGAYDAPGDGDAADSVRNMSAYVSPRDLNHLLVQCIETPGIPFALVHAVSDNRFKRLDITDTTERFGYAPQDDAFALRGVIRDDAHIKRASDDQAPAS